VFDKGNENLRQGHNVENMSKYLLFLLQVTSFLNLYEGTILSNWNNKTCTE